MHKADPRPTPMVVRSTIPSKDVFRPCEEEEEPVSAEIPYLAAVGALMYLASSTRPDIAFAVNLLARHSARPAKRHWLGLRHIMHYLRGTEDMGLLYKRSADPQAAVAAVTGYADAGYLSDPHKAKSQSGYVFMRNDAAFSWKSSKQTLTATSTNHAEILALHDASKEAVWLRSLALHVHQACGLPVDYQPMMLYEDNSACIEQMKTGFIKGDRTKHISPKFYFTHELIGKEIDLKRVTSTDNCADLFTKALAVPAHERMCKMIGLRRLSCLLREEGMQI